MILDFLDFCGIFGNQGHTNKSENFWAYQRTQQKPDRQCQKKEGEQVLLQSTPAESSHKNLDAFIQTWSGYQNVLRNSSII